MSLSQLRSEVNAIKRKLVRELRVVRARRVAEDYCGLWKDLVARKKLPPDPFRLIRNLFKHTRQPGDFAAADGYLNKCRERRHLPASRCNPPPPLAQGSRHGPHILLDSRPGRVLSILNNPDSDNNRKPLAANSRAID